MSFGEFSKLHPAEYFEQIKATGNFWFFHHIPKTAGTSLTHELNKYLYPYRNINRQSLEDPQNSKCDFKTLTERFVEENRNIQFRSASGHLLPENIIELRQSIPNVRFLTFLRDPSRRMLSHYHYARSPKHPRHAEFAAQFPTFQSFFRAPSSRNFMARFLLGDSNDLTPEDAVTRVLEQYHFVGVVEQFELGVELFSTLAFFPTKPSFRENSSGVDLALDPEVAEEIRTLNGIDYAIYEVVKGIWNQKHQSITGFIRNRRQNLFNLNES